MVAQTVTSRALRILEVFNQTHSCLSLSQISCRAALPLSTTHRLVAELAAWGALERDENGRYRIGLRLWEVGALAPRGIGLREAALPFMQDLYEATHENVQLAILDHTQIVYVERIRGRAAVPVYTRPGLRFTPHATGVGLILLAYASTDLQQHYLAQPLRTFTHKTISDPRKLRRVLAQIRRDGFAISDGQVTLDALSVAAPVQARGQVIAALSIVVHASRHPSPQSLTPAVVAAAKGASRMLTHVAEAWPLPTGIRPRGIATAAVHPSRSSAASCAHGRDSPV